MITNKAKRIKAFKKLMEIAQNRSVELYGTTGADHYSNARSWPVDWYKDLGNGRFKTGKDKQHALDEILDRLITVDAPSSVEQLKKEKELTRLILDAGADPNKFSYFHRGRIFDLFLRHGKTHIALEIAKTEGFICLGSESKMFDRLTDNLKFYLQWKKPFPGNYWEMDDKEKVALYAQNCLDDKELVCTLFQKEIYPRDQEVFTKLAPIVLEKDPEFFNKKKEQVLTQMKHAKTPVQIFNALMGKRKEKS